MTDLHKKRLSDRAMFRFSIVSEYKSRILRGQSSSEAIREMADCDYFHHKSERRVAISRRTIYRWLKRFNLHDVDGLSDQPRPKREPAWVLPAAFLNFIKLEKALDPNASVPEIIRRARELGHISATKKISRVTVYRTCLKLNLPMGRTHALRTRDMRRFSYPHRLMMVMVDGKHFNVGLHSTKRVGLFFIDDATRMSLAAVVGKSENTRLFLSGLDQMITKHGLPAIIYFDRGPAFMSTDTAQVLARLGIKLILGKARYPQARGKIERFNRTVKEQLLKNLDKRPDIDTDLKSIELRINHYFRTVYNLSPHESLEQKTPYARYFGDSYPLKTISDPVKYRDAFILRASRKVSNDNIITINDIDYEVPRGFAQTEIEVLRYMLQDKTTMLKQGEEVELFPVDLTLNAVSQRSKDKNKLTEEDHLILPPSAAELRFNRDFGSLLDSEGNFTFNKDN